jgi:hypothetical protein
MNKTFIEIIEALESKFGKPNNNGFGSSVFYELSRDEMKLDEIALEDYKLFMGEKWTDNSSIDWMGGWKKVYDRQTNGAGNIIDILSGIHDPEVHPFVSLLLEGPESATETHQPLMDAFNHPDIDNVGIYKVGDGDAFGGLMIAAKYNNGEVCTVITLMD